MSNAPIPMVLHCPECRTRHVDVGEFATKVHHTHSCQDCGLTWRPAVVPTVGVQFLPGFKNDNGEPFDAERFYLEGIRSYQSGHTIESRNVVLVRRAFDAGVTAGLEAASPAAPAVQTGEAACGCGHILAQHDVGYSTPYQCRAGAVCLCGRFKAAVEPTAGTP